MNLRYLQGIAILFWGISCDLILFAIPMTIIAEARFFTDRRWALTRQDFYRVADLTALGLVGVVLFLFLNRTEYHFITSLTQWLPILFFPLVTVLAWSTTERMPLDVLFYSLRRQREPVTQSWDMSYVYFGLCLVAAGTDRHGASYYLPVVAGLVFLALWQLRPARYAANVWLLLVLVTFLAGEFSSQGLRAGHQQLQEMSRQWLADYIRTRTNPLKTKSAIGTIGRLKTSDEIEFRVEPLGSMTPPRLLQEATYDSPSGTDWMVLNPQFSPVTEIADFTWRFNEVADERRAKIYLEFERDQALVPVPGNVTEVFDLPALELKLSRFGSIQALGLVPSPGFEVSFGGNQTINREPSRADLFVPQEYEDTLTDLLPAAPDDPAQALDNVRQLFAGFEYSLWQDVPQRSDPLIHFLRESRAGHCEYFASAAVLALRQQGVPARYAVGYSVQEYDETIDMYVVRKRHAHSWAIAWVDDDWQIVDTTPQAWAGAEAAQGSPFRPVADLIANGVFLLQLWWNDQRLEDYETHLYVIGGILVVILIWRIVTSEQVRTGRNDGDLADARPDRPGLDSPFYQIEERLTGRGFSRAPGEPFEAWAHRIGHEELLELIPLHNRLRFDPDCPREPGAELEAGVTRWLATDEAESMMATG